MSDKTNTPVRTNRDLTVIDLFPFGLDNFDDNDLILEKGLSGVIVEDEDNGVAYGVEFRLIGGPVVYTIMADWLTLLDIKTLERSIIDNGYQLIDVDQYRFTILKDESESTVARVSSNNDIDRTFFILAQSILRGKK